MSGMRDRVGYYVVKKALFDVATTLFAVDHADFPQTWGQPRRIPDQYVQWLGGGADQERGPLGPNRPRDETVRVESQWFVLRRGEEDAARSAEDYLYDRLGELERHVRFTDPTLGGVALHCFLTNVEADTRPLSNTNAQQFGHIAAAIVTFEARIRITG